MTDDPIGAVHVADPPDTTMFYLFVSRTDDGGYQVALEKPNDPVWATACAPSLEKAIATAYSALIAKQ